MKLQGKVEGTGKESGGSRSVTPAIGTDGARTGCDIRICGVIDGWPASQQTIEGALCPCRAWSMSREEGQQVHHALSAALTRR
jgi:hypothetical protein